MSFDKRSSVKVIYIFTRRKAHRMAETAIARMRNKSLKKIKYL